ncbi:hypothetical protein ScPMuIL_013014 [Solemya velum]
MEAINKEISEACDKGDALDRFTIPSLKGYLRSRAQQVSGNKRELIERAKGAHTLGLRCLGDIENEDYQKAIARVVDKLKTPVGETLDHPSYLDKWTDDVNCIPEMNEKDIYNYFVYKLKTKRQLKAKVMYEDGHVHHIQVNLSGKNESHCFTRARVIPSMPSANQKKCPDYNVWVMLSKATGCINSAECDCTAGKGEGCNHVAALLYAIADITGKKEDGKLAPTSVKCKWNNPRKRKLSPKKSQDLVFKKTVHGRETPAAKKSLPIFGMKTSVNVDRFKEKLLKGNSNAGWLKNFIMETKSVALPKIHNVEFNFCDRVDIRSDNCRGILIDYFSKLRISSEDAVKIECLTRNQSDSDYWMEARQERITASNFGTISKMKETTKPDSVLKDLLGYRTFKTPHTEYGRNMKLQQEGSTNNISEVHILD